MRALAQFSLQGPESDAYALLGLCMINVARLEHTIDQAMVVINRLDGRWVGKWSKGPPKRNVPMRPSDRLQLVCDYLGGTDGKRDRLSDGFLSDFKVVQEHRRSIFHGGLWGLQISSETLNSYYFLSRLGVNNEGGKKSLSLETKVLSDSTLAAIAIKCGDLADELRQIFPEIEAIDDDIGKAVEEFDEDKIVWRTIEP